MRAEVVKPLLHLDAGHAVDIHVEYHQVQTVITAPLVNTVKEFRFLCITKLAYKKVDAYLIQPGRQNT